MRDSYQFKYFIYFIVIRMQMNIRIEFLPFIRLKLKKKKTKIKPYFFKRRSYLCVCDDNARRIETGMFMASNIDNWHEFGAIKIAWYDVHD